MNGRAIISRSLIPYHYSDHTCTPHHVFMMRVVDDLCALFPISTTNDSSSYLIVVNILDYNTRVQQPEFLY